MFWKINLIFSELWPFENLGNLLNQQDMMAISC